MVVVKAVGSSCAPTYPQSSLQGSLGKLSVFLGNLGRLPTLSIHISQPCSLFCNLFLLKSPRVAADASAQLEKIRAA